MHTLSKVLLGVVVVVALLGIMLTSKLFQARGAWLQQVAQRQDQIDTIEEDLRKKRLVVAEARNEVNRLQSLWGSIWPAQAGGNQIVTPEEGRVAIGAGGNQGLGRREQAAGQQFPNVYIFAQQPQGQGTKYLGEFRLTDIEGGRSAARLTRPPYAGELQQWPTGPWRVRESILSNWRSLFTDLHAETVAALQNVQDQQARLAHTDQLNARSQEQLDRRLAQLEGNPDALPGSSQEVMDGLVESLRGQETVRNTDLGQLNALRHEYDRKYRQLMELIDQNRKLEEQLPESGPDSTPADKPERAARAAATPVR